jgi:SH3-like domain-containing protein
VRTHTGQLAWAESGAISERRTIVALQDMALRAAPDSAAPPVAQVRQGVILELLEIAGAWAKVRHREGATGYVRLEQVWGT